ncbi:MAG: hypothetical protein RR630_07155 [Coprobacillus sp.]
MYTYERLIQFCSDDSIDSDIAYYLLDHLDSLNHLSVKSVVDDLGVSKATLHRFFSKGGYENFKDLTMTLKHEIKQKQRFDVEYELYRIHMLENIQEISFDYKQVEYLANRIKKAKLVVFYGNTYQISCFKRVFFYLFNHHIHVVFLDRWNLKENYQHLDSMDENDVFIMVETGWTIQGICEYSMNTKHMLNLDKVNDYSFAKFYIGEANCNQYQNYMNIRVAHIHDYMPYLSLNLLSEKIMEYL